MRYPDHCLPWPIPLEGVAMIAESEGCRLRAYRCPAGVWSIGWGHTEGVRPGDTCTEEQADAWLCAELTTRAAQVRAACKIPPSPLQLAALVSLHYNIGAAAFASSTALRAHNEGRFEAAARAFGLFNMATVRGVRQVLPGLVARRAAEAALYLKPEPDEAPAPMAQAVEPESKPAVGPIATGGAATAGIGGVLPFLDELKGYLGPLGDWLAWAKVHALQVIDAVGLPPRLVPAALLLLAGVAVYRWRMRQRAEGHA